MPINKQGVEQLKADLRAHKKQYNQRTFGAENSECGTEQCLAGFCLLRKLGTRAYRKLVRETGGMSSHGLNARALAAAEEQLGVKLKRRESDSFLADAERFYIFGTIFETVSSWPEDLESRYRVARPDDHTFGDQKALVEVACDALDRLRVNGTIKPLKVKAA